MRTFVLLLLLALVVAAVAVYASDKNFHVEKTFTATASTLTFKTSDQSKTLVAHRVTVCNESTTDSLWFSYDGTTPTAYTADTPNKSNAVRIPPASAAGMFNCEEVPYDKAGISAIQGIAASGKTAVAWVEAVE